MFHYDKLLLSNKKLADKATFNVKKNSNYSNYNIQPWYLFKAEMHLKFIDDNINAVQSVIQNCTWIHFLTAYDTHYINLYSLTCYYNEIKFGYILPEKTIHDNKKRFCVQLHVKRNSLPWPMCTTAKDETGMMQVRHAHRQMECWPGFRMYRLLWTFWKNFRR